MSPSPLSNARRFNDGPLGILLFFLVIFVKRLEWAGRSSFKARFLAFQSWPTNPGNVRNPSEGRIRRLLGNYPGLEIAR